MTLPGVCYCDGSNMSRCAAGDNSKEQEHCGFFDKSMCGPRCMYFIMEEYCDCWKAQEFFKSYGVITWDMWLTSRKDDDEELIDLEDEMDLSEIVAELEAKDMSCSNCGYYDSCPTNPEQYPEGIRKQIAYKCISYARA